MGLMLQPSSPRLASQEVKKVGLLGQAWPVTEGRLGWVNVGTRQEQSVTQEDTGNGGNTGPGTQRPGFRRQLSLSWQ